MKHGARTVCALLALLVSASAQEAGRLAGLITDSAGAPVNGAAIVITNVRTNLTSAYLSNEQGRFTSAGLRPGEYNVSVEMQGFKRFLQTGVVVRVGDDIELPIRLELGVVSESVTVTGETPLIQSNTSAVGEVIEHQLISDLPLNERQPFSLVLLTPGVIPNRQITNAAQPFNRAPNFSISGGRGDSNEIMLDGTPDTMPEGSTGAFKAIATFPTVEGTEEFKVQTNSMAAEYGGSGGGVINIVTKSGTNQYHGALFEFLRNSAMDSNDFFSNRNGIPLASFKRNQFGLAFGGPVIVPRLYNGKNRTFVFVSMEYLYQLGGIALSTTVPTPLQKTGDFSQTLNAQGNLIRIYDPATTTFNTATNTYTRMPFPGNIIPRDRFNPISAKFISLFPDPLSNGLPFTGASNYNRSYTRRIQDPRGDARLDQNFGDKYRIFFAIALDKRSWQNPNVYGTIGDPVMGKLPTAPASGRLGYQYTISPAWVAEVRTAYNHLWFAQYPGSQGYDITQVGFAQSLRNNLQAPQFPRLTFSDLSGGTTGLGWTTQYIQGTQDSNIFTGNISHITGNHAVKFGAMFRRDQLNRFVVGTGDLTFAFARTYTQGPNALAASSTAGSSIASALLGLPDSGGISISTRAVTHNWQQAYYVQDDWRVSRRLTVNAGIRWELQFPMVEDNNNLNWFDPNAASPIAAQFPGLNLKGAVVFAGQDKRNPWLANLHDFAPRVGLAYSFSDKLVLRSGYGVFYGPHPYDVSGNRGSGYSQTTPYVASIDGAIPIANISNPFPNGFVLPFGLGATPSAAVNLGLGINFFEPHSPTPNVQQWNFGLQRQFGKSLMVEAGYDGMKGTHLPDVGYSLTQLRLDQLGPDITRAVPNPFRGLITVGTLSNPTVRAGQLLTPFPQYSSVGVTTPTAASSSYHALLLKAVKRFSNDLTFLLAFTASKLIDDSSGTATFLEPASPHQDAFNRRADRSISDQDVSQRLVYSVSYGLPFGKGKAIGGRWPSAVNALVGGWKVNGILTLQTGIPLSITTTNTSQANNAVLHPNNNGSSAALDGPAVGRLNQYFNTSVFSQPAPYTFGNTGRNLPDVRGPGLRSLDFALNKEVRIHESLHLQIRGEAFNLTNTPGFNNPDTNLQSPTFGAITSQFNQPRQIQVGLRLAF